MNQPVEFDDLSAERSYWIMMSRKGSHEKRKLERCLY